MSQGGPLGATAVALALTTQAVLAAGVLAPAAGGQSPEPYHNYETMRSDFQAMADEHGDVANFRVIGESSLGLELFSLDVALGIDDRDGDELAQLPTLYVDGAHHGNELLSAEAAYHFAQRVLANASEDPSYLEGKRVVITPVVNPDGYTRDYRTNARQVDLNRNYPFHWGLYGTSEVPGHPNYRGQSPASEPETQANIELMNSLNMYAYLTGHTGTYDIVLPWDQDEDGEMPDWTLYENTLGIVENETGLAYRDPSGAGEAHAYAYGNRSAFGILPEVSTEQFNPASTEDVEQRLNEVLGVYRIVWENLTHVGGSVHVDDAGEETLTLSNDGWGPAYNVTAGGETIARLNASETVTVDRGDAEEVTYERLTIPGDSPELALASTAIEPESQVPDGDDEGEAEGVPGPGAGLAAALAGLAALALRRRPRR